MFVNGPTAQCRPVVAAIAGNLHRFAVGSGNNGLVAGKLGGDGQPADEIGAVDIVPGAAAICRAIHAAADAKHIGRGNGDIGEGVVTVAVMAYRLPTLAIIVAAVDTIISGSSQEQVAIVGQSQGDGVEGCEPFCGLPDCSGGRVTAQQPVNARVGANQQRRIGRPTGGDVQRFNGRTRILTACHESPPFTDQNNPASVPANSVLSVPN